MEDVFTVHRRVNAPLEFQGLKGRYIFIAGGIIVASLFFFFAILYLFHISGWICILICAGSAGGGVTWVYRISHSYGIQGWAKRRSARRIPKALLSNTRTIFIQL